MSKKFNFYVDNGSSKELIGSLGKDDYSFISRLIKSKSKGGSNDIIDDILRAAGWDKGITEAEYKRSVFGPVTSIIHECSDVYHHRLKQILDHKNRHTAFNDALQSGRHISISDMLMPIVSTSFSHPEAVIRNLYEYSVTLARIGVGKGEILISMFTNAKKGKTGDLFLAEIGEIEIKGTKGRPGRGRNVLNSLKHIPSEMAEWNLNVKTGILVRTCYTAAYKTEGEIINYLNDMVHKAAYYPGCQLLSGFIQIKSGIEIVSEYLHASNLNKQIEKVREVEKRIIDISESLPAVKFFGKAQKGRIDNLIRSYFSSVGSAALARDIENDHEMSFNSLVKNAFLVDWGLDVEVIIELLIFVVNEDLDEDTLNEFRKGLTDILTPERLEAMHRGDYKTIKALIASIHTVAYQIVTGFTTVIWMNDKDLCGYPMIFNKMSTSSHLRAKFVQFMTKGFNIDPNIDAQSATGVQISYTQH
tara:strand:- start:24547 stop:25968 length:1422 start_codon:yes stop_codon:yes gene_type:complete